MFDTYWKHLRDLQIEHFDKNPEISQKDFLQLTEKEYRFLFNYNFELLILED